GVIPLKSVIRFSIKNRRGKITMVYSQEGYKNVLDVDLSISFDPIYPSTILVMDKQGKETITLTDEVTLL
ncbi:DUF960 domain-containing protein, partial [Streptococcus suis]|uniref:DUF960 family protein n=1 Tax=Streptococcus suis TaxID=1307 RepID=UPI001FCF818E